MFADVRLHSWVPPPKVASLEEGELNRGPPSDGGHWGPEAPAPGSGRPRGKLQAGLLRGARVRVRGAKVGVRSALFMHGRRRHPGGDPRLAAPWDPSRSLVRGGRGGHGAPPHSLPLKPSCRQAPVPEGGCCLSRKLHLHWPAGRGPGVSLGARRTLPRDPPAPHRPATPGAPHQVLQPQHLPVGSRIPRASRRCSGYQLGPRGNSEGGVHPPFQLLSSSARGSPRGASMVVFHRSPLAWDV